MSKVSKRVFQASFTDAYGVQHVSARCFISVMSRSETAYLDSENENANVEGQCNYSVRYWHSEEAEKAGSRTLEYINPQGSTSFYMSEVPSGDMAALRDACEEHFLSGLATIAK